MIETVQPPLWIAYVAPILGATTLLIGAVAAAYKSLHDTIVTAKKENNAANTRIELALDGRLEQLIAALKQQGVLDIQIARNAGLAEGRKEKP